MARRLPRTILLATALLATLLLAGAPARAAGPNAVENLPGCTASSLGPIDDAPSQNPSLGFTANFYGTPYTSLWVNNNGNVTFDQALSTYTPFDFTTTGNVIIAPYLADVDTRGMGNTPVTYGSGTLGDGTHYFCVDWVNVGYYDQHTDKLNSFQLLLTQSPSEAAAGGNFTITFNYDQVQWETGDASGGSGGFGGTPAAVGFSAGDGVDGHDYIQPGSFTSMALEDGNATTGLINNSLNSGGQLGRYVFGIVNGAVTGGTVTGMVFAHDGTTALSNAPVDICPVGGGACFTRATNTNGVYRAGGVPAGTYNVTAHPPADDSEAQATVGPETVTQGSTTTANVTLGPNPNAPPAGTSLTGVGTNPDGIPVINWEQQGTLTTIACGGATLHWAMTIAGQQIAGGQMTQTTTTDPVDGSATYQATYPTVAPNHGEAHIAITGTCPVGGSQVDDEFDIYIDPSGKVVNTVGAPIADVNVTLLRSNTPSGPFIQVPDGSAEMSPANRANPDTTAANGSFGWDTVAGYYQIQATKPGCWSATNHSNPVATSSVLSIPPPAIDLVITMWCGESAGGSTHGGGATGGTHGTGSGPTAAMIVTAQVGASLSGQLRSLLKQFGSKLPHGSFLLSFTAVRPGVVSFTVTTIVTGKARAAAGHTGKAGAAARRRKIAKPITVASGRLTITGAGTWKVRIRLTAAGRSAVTQAAKHHQQLKLALSVSFAPRLDVALLPAVQRSGTFTVRPPATKHTHRK